MIEYQKTTQLYLFVTHANTQIRNVFKEEWKKYTNENWQDNRLSANFVNFGKRIKWANPDQRKLIEDGDTSKWDVSMFYAIFKTDPFRNSKHFPAIREIKNVRNNVSKIFLMNFLILKSVLAWSLLFI